MHECLMLGRATAARLIVALGVVLCGYGVRAHADAAVDYLIVNQPQAFAYYDSDIPESRFPLYWGKIIVINAEQRRQHVWQTEKWIKIKEKHTFRKPLVFKDRSGILQKIQTIDNYWVETKYLTDPKAMEKVTSGWPIRSLSYLDGDFQAKYAFSRDGSVRITHNDLYGRKVEKFVGHVFKAPGLIEIRFPGSRFDEVSLTAGYDEKRKKINDPGEPGAQKQELFPENNERVIQRK